MDTVRLWYMNLAASDVQMVSVFCWAVVALAMGVLAVVIAGRK